MLHKLQVPFSDSSPSLVGVGLVVVVDVRVDDVDVGGGGDPRLHRRAPRRRHRRRALQRGHLGDDLTCVLFTSQVRILNTGSTNVFTSFQRATL